MKCCSHCRDSTSNGSTTNFVFLAISTSHCKSVQLIYSETPTMKKKNKTSKQSKLTDLFIKKDVPVVGTEVIISRKSDSNSVEETNAFTDGSDNDKPVANRISSRRGKLLFVYFLLLIFYLLLFNGFNGFQANQSLNTRNDLTEKGTLDLNSIPFKNFYF